MNRRLFLFTVAAPLYPAAPLVTFTADEAKLIEALCDQIIPADDGPGAKQAGVLYYIDKQLAGPLKRFAPAYKSGIVQFNTACAELIEREFTRLSFEEQTSFLIDIEKANTPGAAPFFRMVVDHVMQGFYGSPQHGGNRDEASWKMLGIADVMEGHKH